MSATTKPPSYEEALAQLKQLQKNGVPESKKQAAELAVAAKMSEDGTIKDLVAEITALAQSAVEIDKGFQDVYVALGKVDNSGFIGVNGKPLPKLQPKWEGFKNRYTKILWDSRDTATSTETYLLDFNEVVLPLIDEAIDDPNNKGLFEDALAELNMFIGRHDPNGGIVDGGDAESHSKAFTQLRRDLEEFKDSFDEFAKKQEGDISEEIEKIKDRIGELNLEIKRCDDIVMAMGIALGITVFATAAGAVAALAAFGPLGPIVAIGVLIFGALAAISELSTMIAYIKKGNNYRKELRAKERELEDLENKLALLKSIQASLEEQKSTIGDIASRLDRFAAVWSVIAHDARTIRDQFQNISHTPTARGLKRRVEVLMKTYAPLRAGLALYATKIDRSGVRRLPPS